MLNILKYGTFILLLASAATSCSTQRKGSASTSSAAHHKKHGSESPQFIEHITIRPPGGEPDYSLSPPLSERHRSGAAVHTGATVELSDPLQFKYSILLDLPVEELTDGRLISFIEEWYGTRYKYGGNDKNGVDCSAFVQTFIYTMYGLMVPRTSSQQYQGSKRLPKEELREGDLVFFKTRGRRAGVSHVGVFLRNNKFVHASTSSGVMINDLDDKYYASHYAGAGRVR